MKKAGWWVVGYYIVEPITKPEVISLPCKQIISASDCISIHHPNLDEFFWVGKEEKAREYQKKFRLSDDTLFQLKTDISALLDDGKIETDGLFQTRKDAEEIYQKYFSINDDMRIIGILVQVPYVNVLREEMGESAWSYEQESVPGKPIGFDIIGWDISGWHSYLCNGLQEIIHEKYLLKVNDQGLIQNSYEEVIDFAKQIEGMGEPVEWIPVAVHDYTESLAT